MVKSIKKDDKVRWKGKLYRVIKGITTVQGLYPPDETPQEYVEIFPDEVIPFWVKPQAHNTYSIGDKVIYEPDGLVYISLIDNNGEEPTKDEPHNRYWEVSA